MEASVAAPRGGVGTVRREHGGRLPHARANLHDQRRLTPEPLRPREVGLVDDVDTAVSYLRSQGVEVMGEPTVRTVGPSAGQTWVYFRAPWGLQFELVSYPGGKGYEKASAAKLWDPRNPAD